MPVSKRTLGFGFLSWLIPFAASVLIFPLKRTNTPLFDNLMAIVLAGTVVLLGLRCLRSGTAKSLPAALGLGLLWCVMNVGLDLLLFSWGPMQMSPGAYFADIGLAYLVHPIILGGLWLAARQPQGSRGSRERQAEAGNLPS